MEHRVIVPREAICDKDDGGYVRTDPRESLMLMGTIQPADSAETFPLRIRNISSGGLMGVCDRAFSKGERVSLDLRNIGPVCGAIAWAGGGRIGVQFDRPIDPKAARKPLSTGTMQTSTIIVAASGKRPGLR